ncbi:MAG: hypothetical protein WCH61_10370, partial [bacterium]
RAQVKVIFTRRLNELNVLVRKQNEDADVVMAKQVRTLTPTPATLAEFRQLNSTVAKQLIGTAYSAAIERQLQESLARQRERK